MKDEGLYPLWGIKFSWNLLKFWNYYEFLMRLIILKKLRSVNSSFTTPDRSRNNCVQVESGGSRLGESGSGITWSRLRAFATRLPGSVHIIDSVVDRRLCNLSRYFSGPAAIDQISCLGLGGCLQVGKYCSSQPESIPSLLPSSLAQGTYLHKPTTHKLAAQHLVP
jgi:hypothetical protein